MKVECISNNIGVLPRHRRNYAYGQDDDGIVDLTLGTEYRVYGVLKKASVTMFLIQTDEIHASTAWWMPAEFFSHGNSNEHNVPSNWQMRKSGLFGGQKIWAPDIYFGNELEIEDATDRGKSIFQQMKDIN